ncbi:MAG: protein phosphatase 2C domain-containing protein [Planctomycetes bacterium]|nr:protein phosphatase 2C domain-containing protein [Planctomycetota bacterium]
MWRHLGYSIRGAAHEADGSPCQDSHLVRLIGDEASGTLLACVADGAGSSKHSDEGSAFACSAIEENAVAYFKKNGSFENLQRDDVVKWCEDARQMIEIEAALRDCDSREYATTLCAAILTDHTSFFFQIGDGAITLCSRGMYGVVFWPQSGEYANSTNFLTAKQYADHIEFVAVSNSFSDVAIFTDGVERLALMFDTLTPHTPFFEPLFGTLRSADDIEKLGEDLRRFLMSESVQSRSDDDKSLILASRIDGEGS